MRTLWTDSCRAQQQEGGCSEQDARESIALSVAAMLQQKLPLHAFEQVE
jgi:hypothetical protein